VRGGLAMQVKCSWCEKFIKEKEPLWDKSISYATCEECYVRVVYEIKKLEEQEDKEKDN
jgi:hypothetical protein